MKYMMNLMILFVLGLISSQTHAQDWVQRLEVQGGRSYMDNTGTPTVFLEALGPQTSWGGLHVQQDVSLGYIKGRHMSRFALAHPGVGDPIFLGAWGGRFQAGDETSWFHPVFFSFQGALHTGKTQALSSTYEFVETLGWEAKRWSVAIRHISNGSLHEPNRGETMFVVGMRLD